MQISLEKFGDLILAILMLIVGTFILSQAKAMPAFGVKLDSPGIMPAFCGVVIIITGIIIGFEGIKKVKVNTKQIDKNEIKEETREVQGDDFKKTILLFAATILYAIAIPYLHFIPCTILFLLSLFIIFKVGSLAKILSIAISFPLLIYIIFAQIFRIILP